jgi:Proteins containing SET domain
MARNRQDAGYEIRPRGADPATFADSWRWRFLQSKYKKRESFCRCLRRTTLLFVNARRRSSAITRFTTPPKTGSLRSRLDGTVQDFHRMSIGWYTNHSKQPNVETRTWKALRDIKKGEEITIDYDAL